MVRVPQRKRCRLDLNFSMLFPSGPGNDGLVNVRLIIAPSGDVAIAEPVSFTSSEQTAKCVVGLAQVSRFPLVTGHTPLNIVFPVRIGTKEEAPAPPSTPIPDLTK
ncbi:MAG: hypothetical protein MUC50_09370 [Myxococcota bacterium]|jgi:hypothetical protein|nr:hypothetical protein [Myxococcota bacterium]